MRVKIIKEEGGNVTVFVKRTMAGENPSRVLQHVPQERVQEAIDQLVGEMRRRPSENGS